MPAFDPRARSMASPSTIATSSIVWCSSMSRSPCASTVSDTPPWWAICASIWSRNRSPVEIPSPGLLLFAVSADMAVTSIAGESELSASSSGTASAPISWEFPFAEPDRSPAAYSGVPPVPASGVPGLPALFPGVAFVPVPGMLSFAAPGRSPAAYSGVPPVPASGMPGLPALFPGAVSAPVPVSPQVPKSRPSRSSHTVICVSRVSRVTTTRRSPRRMYSAISAHESVMSTHASSAPASRSILRPSAAGASRMPFAPRLRASRMSVARSPTT